MFKFNFNIEENNQNEDLNVKEEENGLINQEFGGFDIDDLDQAKEEERKELQLDSSDLIPNVYEGKIIVNWMSKLKIDFQVDLKHGNVHMI
jgi:hypothetical protein